jgi:tRNA(Ile2) C34 agmatinyltransferase TiaS
MTFNPDQLALSQRQFHIDESVMTVCPECNEELDSNGDCLECGIAYSQMDMYLPEDN